MILVTGATGHIGNTLVRELVTGGHAVKVLVLPDEDLSPLSNLPVEIITGNITNYPTLLKAFEEIDYVYHLAGIISISSSKKNKLYKVNVNGTRNVIKACFEKKIKRLVYTSSIHAFSELPFGQILTESKNFDEKTVVGNYGKSKAIATKIVLNAAKKGLDAVIVHPTGVIGPFEYRLSNMGQLIMDYMNQKLYAYIDGSYDFVDVRDVAHGLISACEKGRAGENYILSGEQITIKELITYLEEATGLKGPKVKIPLWIAKITAPLSELYYKIIRQKPLFTAYSIHTLTSNSLTSSKKAKEELGYNCRPIKESIFDTVDWFKKP